MELDPFRPCVVEPLTAAKAHTVGLDRRMAAFASGRMGLVTRDEMLRAGFTRHQIADRIARGLLHPVHRGVYAVGTPRLTGPGRALAAVLAVGGDAAADGATGGALRDLAGWWPATSEVLTTRSVRGPSGVRVRRTRHLPPEDLGEVDGVPCLTTTRLLVDQADRGELKRLERWWRQARRLDDLDAVAVRDRVRSRAGREAVARLIAEDEPDTTNDFERVVVGLLDGLGLPEPMREHWIGPFRLDVFFPTLLLCLEADSWEWHGDHAAFVRDRDRDRELHAAEGVTTLRIPHQDATRRPERVRRQIRLTAERLAELRALEATRSPTSSPRG